MQDVKNLITPEVLVLMLGLFTPWLTHVFKRIFKTEGNATLMANVVINAVAKGALLFMAGGHSWLYAIGYTVIGVISDKTAYAVITGQNRE